MADSRELLQTLVAGHTSAEEEARVLQLLTDADADELNDLLTHVDADQLFSSVDDRVVGPDHRSSLLRLLSVDRRADLSLESLASVTYGLQAGRTTAAMERVLRDIFLGLHGEQLTRFKNLVNSRTDVHDLEGLVFVDIDDDAIRAEILDHIKAEAGSVEPHEAKILSDIDDTVFAKIHDDRYPRGTLYPGILALYAALDHGPDDEAWSTGDLTFLTARPMDALGLIEGHTRQALQKAGIGTNSVLSGSFFNLLTKDGMAAKKLQNVDHYRLLYPEYDLVFIGDSGQGDVKVGEGMYRAHPDAVCAVFIHDVKETPAEDRERYATKRIYFVDTYVGAATKALELDLISRAGLTEVIDETLAGLAKVPWESSEQEDRIRALADRDIEAARALL